MPSATSQILLLGSALALTGCYQSHEVTGPGAFLTAFWDARCAEAVACEGLARPRHLSERSVAWTCEPVVRADLRWGDVDGIADAVALGSVLYDPDEAARCLDEVRGYRCLGGGGPVSSAECAGVFHGTLGHGEACRTDLECVAGRCAGDACPTRCVPAYGSAGDPCTDRCAEGFACVGGVCAPGGGIREGGRCDVEWDCAPGLICVDSACAPGPTAGEPCAPNATCALGSVCAIDGCVEAPAAGAPCVGFQACGEGLRCVCSAPRSCVCWPARRLGEPCDERSACASTDVCREGRCVTRAAAGEPCATPLDCLNGACDAGRCADDPPGAECGYTAPFTTCSTWCGEDRACAPRGDVGAPCGFGYSTGPDACMVGLVCRDRACGPRCDP